MLRVQSIKYLVPCMRHSSIFERVYIWQLSGPSHVSSTSSPHLSLPSRISMVRYVRAVGPSARIFCVPEYHRHPDHAQSTLEHANTLDLVFFAVLTGEYAGIYADLCVWFCSELAARRLTFHSSSQVVSIIRLDPNAHCVYQKYSPGILATWRAFCEENHDHERAWASGSISRCSSPTYSASTAAFDTSPCPSLTESRRASLDEPHPDLPPLTTSGAAPLPLKQPLRSVPYSPPASQLHSMQKMRNTPSPTKNRNDVQVARSAPRESARVPSTRPPSSFSPVKGSSELRFPTPAHTSSTPLPAFPPRLSDPPRTSQPPQSEAPARAEGPLLYAVSIRNRVFMSRDGAFKLFSETEGAQMLLAASVLEAAFFFERGTGLHAMYAVSGERKLFRDRYVCIPHRNTGALMGLSFVSSEEAFGMFLQKENAQMLFSNSSEDAEAFVREHVVL
jgi:hypothetical protein